MHLAESSLKRLTQYRRKTLDLLCSVVVVNGDTDFFFQVFFQIPIHWWNLYKETADELKQMKVLERIEIVALRYN